jgi:flagellar export protein FliJ
MKKFEFSLARVLEVRRKQADIANSRLQTLQSGLVELANEKNDLTGTLTDARESVRQSHSSATDRWALSNFERVVVSKKAQIEAKRLRLQAAVEEQRRATIKADQGVKLLENLEGKHRSEWSQSAAKELESLAADSHLALLLSQRRHLKRIRSND